MARLARIVVPDLPYHVTQRGNGRQPTFFGDDDFALYRDLLAEASATARVQVWAWVLMPNHVHLILVPSDPDGLRRSLALTHRRYAGIIHARERRTGHFWQGRYGAVLLDEPHLAAAVRYIAQNPVRAKLVAAPADWPWSSVHAHLTGADDGLTTIEPVASRIPDFADFIATEADPEASLRLRRAESIGRPLGDNAFLQEIEARTKRILRPAKRGPKSKPEPSNARQGQLL